MDDENKRKYFFCYSLRLRNFLSDKKIRYLFASRNMRSDTPYWVYVRGEELGDGLTDWARYKSENVLER